MIKKIKVIKSHEDLRLDKWLKINFSSLTQSFIEKNLRKKNILVNNKSAISKFKLNLNDEIKILNFNGEKYKHYPKLKKNIIIPKIINKFYKASKIYEDNNFMVLDKWFGISTQGGSKINISIDDIIKNESDSYNLVHRLDKETSGLLIIAKNQVYTKLFGHMFKNHEIEKYYIALCQGKPKQTESLVDLFIPSKENKKINIQTKTYYKLLGFKNNISQILFKPKTGKTHQLRIVSKNLGCPIVGDKKYNYNNKFKDEKLKLNAHILKFNIKSNKYIFKSILPNDFVNFSKNIKLTKYKSLEPNL